jgi:hypothetical protein
VTMAGWKARSHAIVCILFAAALAPTCLAGCSAPRSTPEPRNVALIFIDTLRADRMSLYGYARETTPRIDAFSSTGATFERAYSPSSWTRASFASYFTGLHPSAHGCEDRAGTLSESHRTLAEGFRARGFRTFGFYANANVAPSYGLGQGFDVYEHPPRNASYPGEEPMTDAAEMNRRLRHWLHHERPSEPWLLFALYVDPHAPYLPHAEFEFGRPPTPRVNGSRRFLQRLRSGLPASLGALRRASILLTVDLGRAAAATSWYCERARVEVRLEGSEAWVPYLERRDVGWLSLDEPPRRSPAYALQ